jgi:hypothetical protein
MTGKHQEIAVKRLHINGQTGGGLGRVNQYRDIRLMRCFHDFPDGVQDAKGV